MSFEKKLHNNMEIYKVQCHKLVKYFKTVRVNNNLDSSLNSLSNTFLTLAMIENERSPMNLTIAVPYFLWFLCQKNSIHTREKLLEFLEKINGSILIYCNSPTVYFNVLKFLRAEMIVNDC